MGGADAVVFTGGIGENAPEIRARICQDMEWAGLTIDEAKNQQTVGKEGRISTEDSKLLAYAIPTNEELLIARDTVRVILVGTTPFMTFAPLRGEKADPGRYRKPGIPRDDKLPGRRASGSLQHHFRYCSSSLKAGVPEHRSSSYIIISVDEITAPADFMRSRPIFQFHSAREPTASDATWTR